MILLMEDQIQTNQWLPGSQQWLDFFNLLKKGCLPRVMIAWVCIFDDKDSMDEVDSEFW